MISTDFLLVGQGIAGLLIALELIKKGRSIYIYDEENEHIASRVAGAILNPINLSTGKIKDPRYIQAALKTYREIEEFLHSSFLEQKDILLFNKQIDSSRPLSSKEAFLSDFFRNYDAIHKLEHTYHIKNWLLFESWFRYLRQNNLLRTAVFYSRACRFMPGCIQYKDICAKNIIFCEGAKGMRNPVFPDLPFTRNRGNALRVSIPDLPEQFIYQFKHRLIPLGDQQFWLGSNYQWVFSDLLPDEQWRRESLEDLKNILKLPFQYISHTVAERPTTAGQRVIMEQHSTYDNAFLFNGLGTQGFTIGPFYAKMFVESILGLS